MKKSIYILLLTACLSVSITSCTEEEVKPKQETDNSGGAPIVAGKD